MLLLVVWVAAFFRLVLDCNVNFLVEKAIEEEKFQWSGDIEKPHKQIEFFYLMNLFPINNNVNLQTWNGKKLNLKVMHKNSSFDIQLKILIFI